MAANKLLTPGIVMGIASVAMLLVAILTDHWYKLNATFYLQICSEKLLLSSETLLPLPFYEFDKSRLSLPLIYNPNLPLIPKAGSNAHVKQAGGRTTKSENISTKLKALNGKSTGNLFLLNVQKNQWNELLLDLSKNLYSFGGRDITTRKAKKQKMLNETKSENQCRQRQFSTATGLWRTCYLPDSETLLDKLIKHGNITRCEYITFQGVEKQSIPTNLKADETSYVLDNENISLRLRRAIVSFMLMGFTLQLFGLCITVLGWYRNERFEQHSGGLVLLMSGVLQLAGLGTHLIMCHFEMNRIPNDIYSLPTLTLHGYGWSAYVAWAALASTVLSSFLCVMASLHQPALLGWNRCAERRDERDLPNTAVEIVAQAASRRNTKNQRSIEHNDHLNCPHAKLTIHQSHTKTFLNQNSKLNPSKEKAKRPSQISSSESKNLKLMQSSNSSYGRITSPLASVKTPKAAVKASEAQPQDGNEHPKPKYGKNCDVSFSYNTYHGRTLRPTSDVKQPGWNKKNLYYNHRNGHVEEETYMRKTRSLPHQPRHSSKNLPKTSSTVAGSVISYEPAAKTNYQRIEYL
ncbi:transmembrane protein 178B-like [Clavelina lepadiformis]|uniref:transmembrane protein 178B-like n=1 Tax=Clavelina lepadiformis TaxID=159417 RepID=UPI0040435AB7